MINMHEIGTCEDVAPNLHGRVTKKDTGGSILYSTPSTAHTPGIPINDKNPFHTLVAEQTNNSIQFSYRSTQWKSTVTSGKGSCKLSGQDSDKKGP